MAAAGSKRARANNDMDFMPYSAIRKIAASRIQNAWWKFKARKQARVLSGYARTGGFYGRFRPGGELKFFDTAISFSFDATGEVPATGQLTLIPQGVTESTRIGRKCTVKSIEIRGTMTFTPAATTSGVDDVFLFVVLDKQCNGAAASVTDVLTSNAMGSALVNLENSDRFVILRKVQRRLVSNAGVSAAYSRDQQPFSVFIRCNYDIEYDSSAATGAIGTIRSNNIFLLAGSGLIGDDVSTCDATCRLRFSDS